MANNNDICSFGRCTNDLFIFDNSVLFKRKLFLKKNGYFYKFFAIHRKNRVNTFHGERITIVPLPIRE